MYEQIYNLTSMFFKCLKGNLMYEFLISKFNGKRGLIWTDLWAALNVIISSTEASLNQTGEHWKITFSLNIIRQEVLSVCSGHTLFSRSFQLPSQPFTLIYQSELYSCQWRKTAIAPGPDFLCLFPPFKIVSKKDIHLRVAASCVVKNQCNFFYVFAVYKEFADFWKRAAPFFKYVSVTEAISFP